MFALLGVPGALADQQATLEVEQEGWAWASNDPTEPVEEAVTDLTGTPVQDVVLPPPVPEGGLPVGLFDGEPEFKSYVQFDLFALPFDIVIESFVVTLHLMDQGTPIYTGVEACALVDFWAGQPNQKWEQAPAEDCIFSADGVGNEDGTGTFDLTMTAMAWVDGDLPNNGIVLLPLRADHLDTGTPRPDEATWQLNFAGSGTDTPPQAVIVYGEAPPPPPPPPPPPAQTAPPPPADEPATAPPPRSEPFFGAPPAFGEPTTVPAEEPAAEGPAVAPPPAVQEPATVPTAAPLPAPVTPAYVWLLVPLGLLGMLLLSRSLTADLEMAGPREGATSRLIRRRNGHAAPTGAPAPARSAPTFQV